MRVSLAALALAVVLPLPALVGAAAHANVVVKPGETLSEIAERHGVSVNRLMQANGISDPDLVVVGQELVIPGAGSSRGGGSVTVQPGDTLSEIAARHGLSLNQLMRLNGISDPDLVEAGQRLVVGSSSRSAGGGSAATPTAPYTVRSGETLSEIAERFGTTTERLIQLNRISNPDLVVSGTRLAVPGRPSSGGAASGSRPAAHVVQPGESLSTIAERYGMSTDKLIAINAISDPDLVWAGSRLKLQAPPAPKPAARTTKATAKPAPSPSKTAARTATPAAKPKPQPQIQSQPTAAAQPRPQPQPQPQPTGQQPAVTQAAAAPVKPAATTQNPTTSVGGEGEANPAIARASTPSTAAATTQPVTPTGNRSAASPSATAGGTTAKPAAQSASTTTTVSAASTPTRTTTAKPTPTVTSATTRSSIPAKATTTAMATSTPAQRPQASAKTTTPATASRGKTSGADWRSYGPLQVDWSNWQPMGGSYVAPTLNGDGQALYLAVNCGARKLNATSQSGQWKSWDSPQTDFEQKLITDLCKAKGG